MLSEKRVADLEARVAALEAQMQVEREARAQQVPVEAPTRCTTLVWARDIDKFVAVPATDVLYCITQELRSPLWCCERLDGVGRASIGQLFASSSDAMAVAQSDWDTWKEEQK